MGVEVNYPHNQMEVNGLIHTPAASFYWKELPRSGFFNVVAKINIPLPAQNIR
jgi:hypothetical protein